MNHSEFQLKILQAGEPVIVDFWAPWCLPCRITKPILEKLAEEYAPNLAFLAINADEAPELLDEFQIAGIPTVMAFRDGTVVGRVSGAQNEAGYRAMIEMLVRGKEISIPLSAFDRLLRLTAGVLLILAGISTSNWLIAITGGMIGFLGVYDQCPVWAAISRKL